MASYNRVIIAGNLTRDPEYKQLQSGQGVCRLGLASNRQFKNRQTGMQIQEVCYVDIDVWGPQADSCNQFLQKGRGVLIEGRLKFDTWQDQQGQTRSKHTIVADRVVFLASANGDNAEHTNVSSPVKKEEKVSFGTEGTEKFDQVAEAVAAKKSKKKTAADAPASNAAFKDQPPFEDDLPF